MRMDRKNLYNFFVTLVNIICICLFLLFTIFLLIDFLIPHKMTTTIYQEDLKARDFPVVIKICIPDGFKVSLLLHHGYESQYHYFIGQSKHNDSHFGWSGHSNDSQINQLGLLTLSFYMIQIIQNRSFSFLEQKKQEPHQCNPINEGILNVA